MITITIKFDGDSDHNIEKYMDTFREITKRILHIKLLKRSLRVLILMFWNLVTLQVSNVYNIRKTSTK